jgi:hypothetical protein
LVLVHIPLLLVLEVLVATALKMMVTILHSQGLLPLKD